MNKIKITLIFIISLLLMLFQFCTNDLSGGAVEDGNAEAVSGIITTDVGDTVAYARVNIIPYDFNPVINTLPESLSIITDENGRFIFSRVPVGHYRVNCSDSNNILMSISNSIEITETTTTLVTPQLKQPGTINIDSSGIMMDYPNGVIYLEGTLISQVASSVGMITFEMVPEGTYRILIYDEKEDTSFIVMDSVTTISGGTVSRF